MIEPPIPDPNLWPERGPVFIQWKGTDVCMDFTCPDCGWSCHFDGHFAYLVRCGDCSAVWKMPSHVQLLKVTPGPLSRVIDLKEEGQR